MRRVIPNKLVKWLRTS